MMESEENKKETNWIDYIKEYGYAVVVIAIVLGGMYIIFVPEPTKTTPKSYYCTEFYSSQCPHCANMVPIVLQVENETGITFGKLELYNNTTNQKIFLNFNDSIQRDCGSLGVPTFFSIRTGKAVCGEMSEASLKEFVTKNC